MTVAAAAPTNSALARGGSPTLAPAPPVPVYTGFQQGGWGYLLPAASVVGIVAAEHVRPLAVPVAGWAGTLAMRGGALPVLDAAALLGHGGHARAVAILQAAGGPFGLAVEQITGRQDLGEAPLVPLVGGPGLGGGVVLGGEVVLLLTVDHLAALRQAAIGRDATGQPTPQPVTWASVTAPVEPPPSNGAHEATRVGDPLLVLGDRAADEPGCHLALPLRDVRAVARAGTLRPGVPGAPAVVGYRAWGRLPIPTLDLGVLGITAPLAAGAPGGGRVGKQDAVLLAVPGETGTLGIAVLSAGARGVQRLEQASPPGSASLPAMIVRGHTAAAEVVALSPALLAASATLPGGSPPGL